MSLRLRSIPPILEVELLQIPPGNIVLALALAGRSRSLSGRGFSRGDGRLLAAYCLSPIGPLQPTAAIQLF